MVFLDDGRSGLALAFNNTMDIPNFCAIGSGSGTVTVSTSGLVHQVGSNTFSSTDVTTVKQFTMTADFGATAMSGIDLREFGIGAGSGTFFSAENFPAVTFDGSNELQVQVTFEVF